MGVANGSLIKFVYSFTRCLLDAKKQALEIAIKSEKHEINKFSSGRLKSSQQLNISIEANIKFNGPSFLMRFAPSFHLTLLQLLIKLYLARSH